jgi:hypothetical protein
LPNNNEKRKMQKGGGVVLPALQVSMRKRDGFVPCQQAVVDGEEHVLTLALEPTKEGASGAVWITSLVRIRLALVTKVSLVLNNNSGSPADSFVALSVRDREEDICLKTTSSSTSAVRDLLSNAVAAASGRKRAETRSLDLVVSARAPQLGFGATLQAYLFKLNSKGWKRCFFQLNGAALTYYADEKACTQGLGLGFLDLSQLTLAQTTGHNVQAGTALLSTFRLQISHAREWFIGADDTADAMIWLGQITSAMKRARPKGPHLFVPNAPKEAESQVWARVSSALGCYEADAEEKPRAATEESRRLAKALLLMLDEAENSPETEAASSDVMEQVDSLTNQIFDDATLVRSTHWLLTCSQLFHFRQLRLKRRCIPRDATARRSVRCARRSFATQSCVRRFVVQTTTTVVRRAPEPARVSRWRQWLRRCRRFPLFNCLHLRFPRFRFRLRAKMPRRHRRAKITEMYTRNDSMSSRAIRDAKVAYSSDNLLRQHVVKREPHEPAHFAMPVAPRFKQRSPGVRRDHHRPRRAHPLALPFEPHFVWLWRRFDCATQQLISPDALHVGHAVVVSMGRITHHWRDRHCSQQKLDRVGHGRTVHLGRHPSHGRKQRSYVGCRTSHKRKPQKGCASNAVQDKGARAPHRQIAVLRRRTRHAHSPRQRSHVGLRGKVKGSVLDRRRPARAKHPRIPHARTRSLHSKKAH